MELKDKIVDLLKKSEPMKGGEIAEALGEDKKAVDKALKDLKRGSSNFSKKMLLFSRKIIYMDTFFAYTEKVSKEIPPLMKNRFFNLLLVFSSQQLFFPFLKICIRSNLVCKGYNLLIFLYSPHIFLFS